VHFIPLHLHPFYRDTMHADARQYPCATQIFEKIISLPLYPRMSAQDQQDVIDAVHRIIATHRQ
jgi:dTDP-4-amino-4,6-dideoxygalactose transaminase